MTSETLGAAVLELRTDDTLYVRGLDKARTLARDFERDIKDSERAVDRLGRSLDALGSRVQRVGQRLSLFLTAPLVAFGVLSVKTASDAQELGNLIEVTFGASAAAVEDWSERMAVAMNRSSLALLKAAGDFAAFLKPLGVAPEMVVPMSTAMSQLTTDLSSFRNIAEEDVFTALFSGLAGETEAVRRLGIDIGQAAVEAELLRLGFQGNVSAASQADKVIARYNLILKQTRDAQGDAARTAASFENQTRGLGATLIDIRRDIGERLLPMATEFVTFLNVLGRRFLALSDEAKNTALGLAAFAAAIGPGLIALGLLVRGLGFALIGLAAFSRGVRAVVRAVLASFAVLAAAFASPVVAAVAAATAILAAWVLFKETMIATSRAIVDGVSFWMTQQFRNSVERPFLQAINDMIEALPATVREALGIVTIDVPVEIEGSAGDIFAQGFADAREAARRETAQIEEQFAALAERVKSVLPKGLADLLFGDFTAMQEEIGAATGEIDGLIERLVGGAGAGGKGKIKEETDALRDFMVALENETALLRLSDDEREVRQAIMRANAIAMQQNNLLTREQIALIEAEVRAQQDLRRAAEESREAEQLVAALATEHERLNAQLDRARELFAANALSAEEYGLVQERLQDRISGVSDSLDELGQAIAAPFVDGITSAESFMDILGSVESSILRVANTAIENSLADFFTDQFRGFGEGGGSGGAGPGAGPGSEAAAGGGGVFGFLGDVFGTLFHEGTLSAGRGGPGRRVPAEAYLGAPRLQTGTLPGLRPDEIAAIIHREEIVLDPAQSARVRAGLREGGGGGGRFGDINVLFQGAPPADPRLTGDQIGLAVRHRLDDLEREA